jgi:hypothetical protein
MTFDHLTDGEFEELTYDLLHALGFVNLDWRRGSGKGGATADQGRDVVGQFRQTDVDGSERFERWFVQCKRYERGVPPEALNGALTWASAESPDILLFVVSNSLSNPAKTWLDDFERNRRPPFRVKVWERKLLEQLIGSHTGLVGKYRLKVDSTHQNIHPAHVRYASRPVLNSLDFFLDVLDSLDPALRDDAFSFGFVLVINPRRRVTIKADEAIGDRLFPRKVDYATFRTRCRELVDGGLSEQFVVQGVMNQALAWTCGFADPSQLPVTLSRHTNLLNYFIERIGRETNEARKKSLLTNLTFAKKMLDTVPDRQRRWAECYSFLCEDVLPRLEAEDALAGSTAPPAE